LAIGVGVSILRHAGGQASAEKLVQATDCAADREKKSMLGKCLKIIFFHTLAYWRILLALAYKNTPKSYWLATLVSGSPTDPSSNPRP